MDQIVSLAPGLATGSVVVLCIAIAVSDARHRRIPNWLTLGTLAIALALRTPGGWTALGQGLGSAALAFAFGLPFFLLGGLGGGDVKSMTGLAAFLDLPALVPALVVMAITGGVMAVVGALRQRMLRQVLRNVGTLLMTFVNLGRQTFSGWQAQTADGVAEPGSAAPETVTNPYGVAIAAGALAGWFLR